MNSTESQRVDAARAELQRIHTAIETASNDWERHVSSARAIIVSIDSTTLMQQTHRAAEQAWLIAGLQRFAYYQPDSGGVEDIAEWCVSQWLRLLQQVPESVEALQGLGQAWLSRSQQSLARIHREEGSSSSGTSGGRPATTGGANYSSSEEARDAARAAAEADARLHTADYVEARGILLPSTEYLSQAVDLAERTARLNGELLALAAEAYMSLGNVSYSYANERYFRQALIYLRRASQLPGYNLSPYLQNYLDEYGRLID